MATFTAIGPELLDNATQVRADLETARTQARTANDQLQEVLARVFEQAGQISTRAEELSSSDLLPQEFTGVIHNYRYGMVGKTPMHRFDVDVVGTGLWLACMFSSSEFDELIKTAEPPMDLFEPSVIDGKRVTIRRDAKLGRLIPVRFADFGAANSPELLRDQEGNPVCAGDIVSIRETGDSFSRSFKATVVGYEKSRGRITVQQVRQKGTKTFKVSSLFKFINTRKEVLAVTAALGTDINGQEIREGDIVRLLDTGKDGQYGGKVLGAYSSNIEVERLDGVPGGGPNRKWGVSPARTFVITPVATTAKYADGSPVKTADYATDGTYSYIILGDLGTNVVSALRSDGQAGSTVPGAVTVNAVNLMPS